MTAYVIYGNIVLSVYVIWSVILIMKLGMVGLPNVGKSTLFNALAGGGAQCANYPFCTIEPNVGIVSVPDKRLDELAKIYNPKKVTPATLEFVDIAGLVKGASKGEGLGNKFLANIREVDAIVHVVRCFEDANIVHVDGSIDPIRDIETINLELIFSDIEILQRRIDKFKKQAKGDKSLKSQICLIEDLLAWLEDGKSARGFIVESKEDMDFIDSLDLLSSKPVIYAANLLEEDYLNGVENNQGFLKVVEFAKFESCVVFPICAKIEEELNDMLPEDKTLFLEDLGLSESGLERIIKTSYNLLGLISFLTAGTDEVRAWTIKNGTKAPKAAGKIHTDFEKGFIRAEVIGYDEFKKCGSMVVAKEKVLVRLEGKNYVMKDGDIVLFRFNV